MQVTKDGYIISFTQCSDGELYAASTDGQIFRIDLTSSNYNKIFPTTSCHTIPSNLLTISVDEEKKLLTLKEVPAPEILSIEHDMDYYNFENGLFNMITNKDITEMGFEAKDFIAQKAEEGDLFAQAEVQREQLFEVLKLAIEASGWQLIVRKVNLNLKD